MSLGDHDTFSMYGCPASLRREAFALPPNDAPLAAPFTLAVDTRLRVGLDSLGYPVVAGEDAAASALRHLGAARADSRSLDRLLDEHGGRGAEETLPDAVKRALRVVDDCYHVASAHGRRAGEAPADAFARMFAEQKAEIVARGRRIEELRDAGESLSTLMGQLSAAEADIATLTARAEKAEAEADRLRGNARTTHAHANIATCFGNGFVSAMEANGVPLHDQNPLGLRRILATRAALEARAEKAESEVARLSAPVDVEAAVEKAACDIADALDAVHAEWSAGAFRGKRDDMPPRAAAEARDFRDRALAVLRSLARQAPSAAAKDEGERGRLVDVLKAQRAEWEEEVRVYAAALDFPNAAKCTFFKQGLDYALIAVQHA